MIRSHTAMLLFACLPFSMPACGDETAPTGSDIDTRNNEFPPETVDDTTPDVADVPERPKVAHIVRIDVTIDRETWEYLDKNPHADLSPLVRMNLDGAIHDGVELEIHGGYARQLPKKSVRFKFASNVTVDLFGDGPESMRRFVLKGSWVDRSWLREKLTYDLIRAAGGLAPRTAYAELILNGTWHGLYVLVERIDRPYLKRNGLEDDDVHLYKAEDHRADWGKKADPVAGYDIQLGEEVPPDDLGVFLTTLADTPANADAFAASVEPILSLDDYLTWQRVHTFAANRDTFTKNYYLYHDLTAAPGTPQDRFRIITWDADATFGNEWEGTPLPGDSDAWHGHDRFAPRLFSIPLWRQRHRDLYREALAGDFAPAGLIRKVRDHAADIRALALADLSRWQPEGDFDAEIERLVAMINLRHTTMSKVLETP